MHSFILVGVSISICMPIGQPFDDKVSYRQAIRLGEECKIKGKVNTFFSSRSPALLVPSVLTQFVI